MTPPVLPIEIEEGGDTGRSPGGRSHLDPLAGLKRLIERDPVVRLAQAPFEAMEYDRNIRLVRGEHDIDGLDVLEDRGVFRPAVGEVEGPVHSGCVHVDSGHGLHLKSRLGVGQSHGLAETVLVEGLFFGLLLPVAEQFLGGSPAINEGEEGRTAAEGWLRIRVGCRRRGQGERKAEGECHGRDDDSCHRNTPEYELGTHRLIIMESEGPVQCRVLGVGQSPLVLPAPEEFGCGLNLVYHYPSRGGVLGGVVLSAEC